MKYVITAMLLVGIAVGFANGGAAEVSASIISSGEDTIALAITLAGIICLWSGVMSVAKEAGIIGLLSKAFAPVLSKLFKGLDVKGKAFGYITLNIISNMLGMGNASTPFGLMAMKELEKEEHSGDTATPNMILFVIMNTASLQLLPATMAALRLKHGSVTPLDVLPAVWLTSIGALTVAILAAKLFQSLKKPTDKVV